MHRLGPAGRRWPSGSCFSGRSISVANGQTVPPSINWRENPVPPTQLKAFGAARKAPPLTKTESPLAVLFPPPLTSPPVATCDARFPPCSADAEVEDVPAGGHVHTARQATACCFRR